MNTKVIVGVVAALIVIGGGTWYVMSQQAPEEGTPNEESAESGAPAKLGSGSIADLWGMTGTLQCDIKSTEESAPFTGTLYVSSGNVRADIVATVPNMTKPVASHMIRSGGFMYSWSDLIPQGVKIPDTATQGAASGSTSQGVSANAKVSYTCKPWAADTSIFTPPTNVTFMTVPGSAQ